MSVPTKIQTWQMVKPTKPANPKTGEAAEAGVIERTEIDVPPLGPGDALVKVAGCGVCHTDLSYFYDGVPTVAKPPLTLGHEIAGTVLDGPAALVGKNVIIPAVIPCNNCPICASGRGNRCLAQKMPGNSIGMYGGFSSHIVVPADGLCVIDDLKGLPLSHYAVVADAGTTPYQAAVRADLKPGDNVIVIGSTGGVGIYMTQTVKAMGAKFVIAMGRNDEKLKKNLQYGADATIDLKGKDDKAVKEEMKAICKANGLPSNFGWKIFECTGSKPGQELGLSLLSFTGKLVIVGYGMVKTEYMLSKLMAFDADIIGTWGCLPKYYPEVLKLVQAGKVQVEPFIEMRPMSTIRETFEDIHHRKVEKRVVLEPDF
jgi:6-hydroxycyclohex-1-ene-1-carbonyl-CoA dehydrogenase